MTVLATVNIPAASGLPEDVIVNTFHFEPLGGLANGGNIVDMLKDFYDADPPGGTDKITDYMTGTGSGGVGTTWKVKIYDLGAPSPRVPWWDEDFTVTLGGGVLMPTEVALVNSFHAAPVSGTPQARRRNRIYLGPFVTATLSSGRVASTLVSVVRRATMELKAAGDASITWNWVGYSPTDNESWEIAGGWVDNAWDTQRRRGMAATTRNVWP